MHPLTPAQLEAVLAEAVRRLRAEFGPCRVYLFGSYAEGRAGQDSDLDLMVVLPGDSNTTFRHGVRGLQALSGVGHPIDVLVRHEREFNERSLRLSTIEHEVFIKGRMLHAA